MTIDHDNSKIIIDADAAYFFSQITQISIIYGSTRYNFSLFPSIYFTRKFVVARANRFWFINVKSTANKA